MSPLKCPFDVTLGQKWVLEKSHVGSMKAALAADTQKGRAPPVCADI